MTTTYLTSTDLTSPVIRSEAAQPRRGGADGSGSALFLVVGYDGSGPSRAALEAATQIMRGADGHLEIVYVAHVSGIVEMSAGAVVALRQTFAVTARELEAEVRSRLDDREPRWHFQRRNGSVAEQLVAVASELRRKHGQDATVIIVGASTQLAHHIAGSVPVALARKAGFPLLVVPASGLAMHPRVDRSVIDPSEYLG